VDPVESDSDTTRRDHDGDRDDHKVGDVDDEREEKGVLYGTGDSREIARVRSAESEGVR